MLRDIISLLIGLITGHYLRAAYAEWDAMQYAVIARIGAEVSK